MSYEPSAVDTQEPPGMSMKPTGTRPWSVISIGPLIEMGSWLTSGSREKRDRDAAKRFFQQAARTAGHAPERVTTDGHDSYPRAIREILGSEVLHRCNPSLNNRLEQDHRGIRTTLLPHAWVRKRRVSSSLLPCI